MAVSGVTINGDGTATWLITAEDSATLPKGPIAASLKLWRPFIPRINDLYAYWSLDEAAGNTRAKTLGTAASADLAESGGAVTSGVGHWGNCVVSADGDTFRLVGTVTPMNLSGGFTLAIWAWLEPFTTNRRKTLFSIGTGAIAGDPHIVAYRYFLSDWVAFSIAAAAGTASILFPFPTAITTQTWHLFVLRYDPATGLMSVQMDGATAQTAAVDPAVGGALTALDTVNLVGGFNVNHDNWLGKGDAPAIWTAVLSDADCAGFYTNPNPVETASGDIQSQDSTTALVTTPATWTTAGGVTLTLSESTLTQASAFTSVLTATDAAGDTVDLTGWSIFADLSYDPQGSATALPLSLPTRVIISGEIRYTDYASGTSPRPTPIWAGVTVSLFDSTSTLLATTTTDAAGLYQFVGTVAEGTDVYVKVTAQLPPGEAVNETKTGSTFTAPLGVTAVNLVCDRAPI